MICVVHTSTVLLWLPTMLDVLRGMVLCNIIHAIQQILLTISKETKLKEWTTAAQDQNQWTNLIDEWWSETASAVIVLEDKYEKWEQENNQIITARREDTSVYHHLLYHATSVYSLVYTLPVNACASPPPTQLGTNNIGLCIR